MRDEQVGSLLRAIRHRAGLRQADVARRCGLAQQHVSRIERGDIDRVSIHALRAVARVLDVSIAVTPRWRGADAGRLLDAAHAELVEYVVARLRETGWIVLVEYTFSAWGERGSVDVVAWHPARRALAIFEVKSQIVESHELHSAIDRKARLVPRLLRDERGWRAIHVGRIAVVTDTSANRSRLSRHAATRAAALPADTRQIKRWLADPDESIAGVWFVRFTPARSARRVPPGARRVRVRRRRVVPPAASVARGEEALIRPERRPPLADTTRTRSACDVAGGTIVGPRGS